MTIRSCGFVIVLVAVLSQTRPCLADNKAYVIEPSDVLRLEVLGIAPLAESVQGEHVVRPDGTISLGDYGSVNLSGKTVSEARTDIKGFLVSRARPDGKLAVWIEVVARNSKVYYIVAQDDEGQQVSRFRMDAKETVVAAVLRVEGLAAIAANEGVCIARSLAGRIHTLDVDWRAITQEGRLATNHTLRPGDRVYLGQSPPKSISLR